MASTRLVTIATREGLIFSDPMQLHPHPASPPSPARTIDVQAVRIGSKLSLVFTVSGDIGAILVPEGAASPQRKDGLWRHSCFEAFIRLPDRTAYLELNLSPSGDWAAYRFDGYRTGMQPAELSPPVIEALAVGDALGVVAAIDLASAIEPQSREPWPVALSAVIEAKDGSLSHWALAHPQGAADFHHPDCFVLDLPPAGEP